MNYVVLDAETYWADDYTLSKSTSEEYIRDPRFKVHGWGVHPVGGRPRWLTEEQFVRWAKVVDWSNTAIICHNTRFDGAIIGWKYGVNPRLWVDTMGVYRALHPYLGRFGLAALGRHFGYGEKGSETTNTKNKLELSPAEWQALGGYCATNVDSDCNITMRLFLGAWDGFPPFERAVMDMTLRMFINPVFEVDLPVLERFLELHVAEKKRLLDTCGANIKDVMSSPKFAGMLHDLGVDPPMKPSPSDSSRQIYAFAKTDEGMTELVEHEDPRVQVLAAARLGNKSTILETRTQRIIGIGSRGAMPIPLNYWGALVTGRHCLTGDTCITVLRNGAVLDILIPELLPDDLVWDSEDFVAHGGLLDQGEREVMSYGGITGTPDHRVFCEEVEGAVELRTAGERGYTIKAAAPAPRHWAGAADAARRSPGSET